MKVIAAVVLVMESHQVGVDEKDEDDEEIQEEEDAEEGGL